MPDHEAPEQREEQGQEKWYERMRYQILLFTGGIALFVLVGGWILHWYIAPHTSAQKEDLVQALGLITAGVAGAIGIFFTWRGQRLTQKGLQDTLRTTREGQITDRFTRAIDQLGKVDDEGNKLFEIRIGGIYALERIARESEEDHWPIMEVLAAYVRQHAPWRPEESEPPEVPTLDPDIQAIIAVIRRRDRSLGHGEPEPLDLHRTSLRKANLREVNLRQANLTDADLRGADLRGADLSRARGLIQTQSEEAIGDETTALPPNLKPPAHWGEKTDEQPEED